MGLIGLDDLSTDFNLNVFPNPSDDIFVISGKELTGNQLMVFNSRGELIYEEIIKADQTTINLANQASGLYLLRIANDSGFIVHKLSLK